MWAGQSTHACKRADLRRDNPSARGYGLTEEMQVNHGRVMNANLLDYKILTAKDKIPITRSSLSPSSLPARSAQRVSASPRASRALQP